MSRVVALAYRPFPLHEQLPRPSKLWDHGQPLEISYLALVHGQIQYRSPEHNIHPSYRTIWNTKYRSLEHTPTSISAVIFITALSISHQDQHHRPHPTQPALLPWGFGAPGTTHIPWTDLARTPSNTREAIFGHQNGSLSVPVGARPHLGGRIHHVFKISCQKFG